MKNGNKTLKLVYVNWMGTSDGFIGKKNCRMTFLRRNFARF